MHFRRLCADSHCVRYDVLEMLISCFEDCVLAFDLTLAGGVLCSVYIGCAIFVGL